MSLHLADDTCTPAKPCMNVDECHCWLSGNVCASPEYLSEEDRDCQCCGWHESEHDCE